MQKFFSLNKDLYVSRISIIQLFFSIITNPAVSIMDGQKKISVLVLDLRIAFLLTTN